MTKSSTQIANHSPYLVTFKINNGKEIEDIQMLHFSSWEEFEDTATLLENEVEIFDDNFLIEHSHLNENELDDYEESINYTDQIPMIDFEARHDFNTPLRLEYNKLHEIYVESDLTGSDPDVDLPWDGGELSLVNNRQQVMIDGEIFQTFHDGYVSFSSDYEANLTLLAENKIDELQNKINVTSSYEKSSGCKWWKASHSYDDVSSSRRIKLIAKIRSFAFYSKQKKMSVSYKHKRGKFRVRRTHMAVDISNRLDQGQCGSDRTFKSKPRNTYKKKRRRDIKTTVWGGGLIYTPEYTGVRGKHYHYASRGINPIYGLEW